MNLDAYRDLTIRIYDIRNIRISHPDNRPIGKIILRREVSDINRKSHFVRAACITSLSTLHKLKDKPYMCTEIEHKLAEDVYQGVLLKLDDFLVQGVTKVNADLLVVPSPIHIVANPAGKSSPVRLVGAPNHIEVTTKQSINSALHSGLPHYRHFLKTEPSL